jgi:hypothetical protein
MNFNNDSNSDTEVSDLSTYIDTNVQLYAGYSRVFLGPEPVDVICFRGVYYQLSNKPSGLLGRFRVLQLDHLMMVYDFRTRGWYNAFQRYFDLLREKTTQFLALQTNGEIENLMSSSIELSTFTGVFKHHGRFLSRVFRDLLPDITDDHANTLVWSMNLDEDNGLFYPTCDVRDSVNSSMLLVPRIGDVLEAHMGVLDQPDVVGDSKVESREQQFMFADDREGHKVIIPSAVDEVRSIRDEKFARFENFFQRPLKLNAYKWQVGGTLFADINPWDDYLEHPVIVNRINNFKLLRGTLCFKIIVSGTPFHFGRAIAAYQPLHRYDTISDFNTLTPEPLVRMTSLPKVFIDPSDSSGGYMELPFFYHRDYVNITKREWINLGNIFLRTLNPLKHANGANNDVTVTTFAWMKDVELAAATSIDSTALQPQMGEIDEANKEGAISGPATKVAGMAAKLGKVPYIGPYADATEMAAKGVASMAKLFGMSRPPQTKNVEPYKPEALSSLALTTVPDRSAKLTVDDKQEMSIDPRISGTSSTVDPLSIQNIVSHESWFDTFTWAVGDNVETFLWNCRVNPMIWRENGAGTIYLTSVAYAALPFNTWSGSLEFRVQVVCSKMHNGKLRINYDPNYNSVVAGDATLSQYLTSYSKVIDLRHSNDCTISIPMNQVQTFMEMPAPGLDAVTEVYSTTQYAAISDTLFNGTISISVLNELTTPNSTADNDVEVNVYVKGGKDLTFREPTNLLSRYEVVPIGFDPQMSAPLKDDEDIEVESGTILDAHMSEAIHPDGDMQTENKPTQEPCMDMTAAGMSTKVGDVYYGEIIESFRPLIKRFNHHERIVPVESDLLGAKHLLVSRAAFPRLKGFMPNAVTPTLAPVGDYNFVNMTLLNYITLGYAGARGAIRWKFSPTQAASSPMQIRAEHRNVRFGQTNLYDESTQTITTSLQNPLEIVRRAVTGGAFPGEAQVGPFTGLAGGALNHSSVNGTLEIEIPYYTPLRFEPGKRNNYEVRDLDYDRGYPYDRVLQLDVNYLLTNADIKVAMLDAYVAAGEDFTTYFFTGAPPLFYRETLPTVV